MVGELWERVSVDINGHHPRSSRGKQFISTLVDHFSKWAESSMLHSPTVLLDPENVEVTVGVLKPATIQDLHSQLHGTFHTAPTVAKALC